MNSRARKGFNSIGAIPPAVRAALDRGDDEPRTLAEWLAVDTAALLDVVLRELGLGGQRKPWVDAARSRSALPALQRQRQAGAALLVLLRARPDAAACYELLATHRSGVVREWAALALASADDLPLARRLDCARHFASDASMNVREIAWMSFREHAARELDLAVRLLAGWVRDADAGVRRCAVESLRPRGVWCAHIDALKREPALAAAVLEPVGADPSRYVQLSVANWVNDASKSQPAWAQATCARWLRESPVPETAFIVRRALRTLQGADDAAAHARDSRRPRA